jgi:hypothetical protein
MTTYIDLCKRLRQEVGASGSDSTVVGASGEWKRICDWIAISWNEIQKKHPIWEWMRANKSFNTIANQGEYAYASSPLSLTDFASWRNNSFRLYKDSTDDEQFLDHWSYNDFRDEYLLGSNRTTYSRPIVVAVSPSKSLLLGSPPDDVYTVVAEYYKTPTTLSADADEPGMPERFHEAIVYRAMIHYGMYEAAQEVVARGERFYREYMEELEFDQLPPVTVDRSFI